MTLGDADLAVYCLWVVTFKVLSNQLLGSIRLIRAPSHYILRFNIRITAFESLGLGKGLISEIWIRNEWVSMIGCALRPFPRRILSLRLVI